jgi:isocitrate dehydrogenase (NAD+)
VGEEPAAKKLEAAVASVIEEGKSVTYDLKKDKNDLSAVGTREMADAVIKKIK